MKLLHKELDNYISDMQATLKDAHPGASLNQKKNAIFKVTGLLNILYANNPLLEREEWRYRIVD